MRRHLGVKVPVSDLADEYEIQPSLITLWIKWSITSNAGPRAPNCQPNSLLRWLELSTSKFHPWSNAWQGQRTQRPADARLVVGGLGEAGNPRLPRLSSAGGLPQPDLHNARRRHRGGQSVQRLSRAQTSQTTRSGMAETRAKRHWFCVAATSCTGNYGNR